MTYVILRYMSVRIRLDSSTTCDFYNINFCNFMDGENK
jgi:hypothetical protein